MGEDLFVVVMEGVYRHDIVGVFSTITLATEAAKEAQEDQRDTYHDWIVLRYPRVNERVKDGEFTWEWDARPNTWKSQ